MPKQRDLTTRIAEMEQHVKILRQLKRVEDERAKLKELRPAHRRRRVQN